MLPVGTLLTDVEGIDLGPEGAMVVEVKGDEAKLVDLSTDEVITVDLSEFDFVAEEEMEPEGITPSGYDEDALNSSELHEIRWLPTYWGPRDPNNPSSITDVSWRPEPYWRRFTNRYYNVDEEQRMTYKKRPMRRTAKDYSWVTQEMFDRALVGVVEDQKRTLLSVPGVWEVASEELNNEALDMGGDFEDAVQELLSDMSADEILALPGMYEALSEEFNNYVLEDLEGGRRASARTAEVLEQGNYVTLEQLPNGDLKMIATDELREEFGDFNLAEGGWDYYSVMHSLLEDIQANSEWSWVEPAAIGAMTDAPIITDGMDWGNDVDGLFAPYPDANIWWYPNYMVRDFIEDLVRDGETVFKLEPAEEPRQAAARSHRTAEPLPSMDPVPHREQQPKQYHQDYGLPRRMRLERWEEPKDAELDTEALIALTIDFWQKYREKRITYMPNMGNRESMELKDWGLMYMGKAGLERDEMMLLYRFMVDTDIIPISEMHEFEDVLDTFMVSRFNRVSP